MARGSAVVVGLTLTAAAALDCYGHQCDASNRSFPSDAGQGRMLDDNTYETNAIDEPWLNYPGNVNLRVNYPKDDIGRPLAGLESYVGTSQLPIPSDADSATWTPASGALVEITASDSTGFTVMNATCATYYARFVVHFAPRPMADGGQDAPEDSTTSDTGSDAGVE